MRSQLFALALLAALVAACTTGPTAQVNDKDFSWSSSNDASATSDGVGKQ